MANVRKPMNVTAEKKIRKNPFDRRDRLQYVKDPKYRAMWFNDTGTTIQDMLEAGFQFVSEKERWGYQDTGNPDSGKSLDDRVSVNVGRAGGQENVIAYLMRMPIQEYEEMMAPERERRKEPMREILRQKDQMKQDGYYGDIKL